MTRKKFYVFWFIFFTTSKIVALEILETPNFLFNSKKEIFYYDRIKEPLKNLFQALPNFIGTESSGIFFRNKDSLYSKNFSHLPKYYRLCRKKIEFKPESFFLRKEQLEKDLEKRYFIILGIQTILSDTNDLINIYFEKIDNKEKPISKIGLEGTIKIFKKVGKFYQKHMNTLLNIYIHEQNIFSTLTDYIGEWNKSFLFSEEETIFYFEDMLPRVRSITEKYRQTLSLISSKKPVNEESKKLFKRHSSTKIRLEMESQILITKSTNSPKHKQKGLLAILPFFQTSPIKGEETASQQPSVE